jgi:hypothetical protein
MCDKSLLKYGSTDIATGHPFPERTVVDHSENGIVARETPPPMKYRRRHTLHEQGGSLNLSESD